VYGYKVVINLAMLCRVDAVDGFGSVSLGGRTVVVVRRMNYDNEV